MKKLTNLIRHTLLSIAIGASSTTYGVHFNQTHDLSPVYSGVNLPFKVEIEQADFELPNGLSSYAWATYDGKWLFLCGRTNGMHTFNDDIDNFPPQNQNQTVYVVDPRRGTVASKALTDPTSGLTQTQIDSLSVTASQHYSKGRTLYITGGYGVETPSGQFTTKDTLTAINIPGLMHWVTSPDEGETAVQHIRQISDPIFRVTGGSMFQNGDEPTLLIFGQDFEGFYFHFSFDGIYTRQVRRFHIIDKDNVLSVKILPSFPSVPDSSFRRRDLNIVPVIRVINDRLTSGYVAFSGVFTPQGGIWTVPVEISARGVPFMADPENPATFKQAMNNYFSSKVGLFSKDTGDSYTVIFGGISYQFFDNGYPVTDPEFPFVNQMTAIKIDKCGTFSQYLLDATYPVILSTQSNPGNQLLFGTSSNFIPVDCLPSYSNEVIKLDDLSKKRRTLIGYIVGGIMSTLPNTNVASDSAASPYIFKVYIVPN